MKTRILAAGLLWACLAGACTRPDKPAADAPPAAQAPVMKFAETAHDFGTIQEGAVVAHTFAFTNTGSTPLVIENAVASCGCTVPDWPRTPVAPGASGQVKVEFNSRGKAGPQQKSITIYANTLPRESVVVLSGVVNAAQP